MQRLNCSISQLDEKNREYLQEVRKTSGQNFPGIFVPQTAASFSELAFWLGIVIVVVGSIVCYHSNKDAEATALLLAGAFLLGSWLIWYGVSEWSSADSDGSIRSFIYFDPINIYSVSGREVTITRVDHFESVEPVNVGIAFTQQSQKVVIPVSGSQTKREITRYYRSIQQQLNADASKVEEQSLDSVGTKANFDYDDPNPIDQLMMSNNTRDLPKEPTIIKPSWAYLRLALAVVATGFVYFIGVGIFSSTRDDSAYKDALEHGAAGLRGYLTDPRNTNHRQEAEQKLAAFYDSPIATLSKAIPEEYAKTREAFVRLLNSLRTASQPVVSMSVREISDRSDRETREARLRTELADALGLTLGRELIGFVQKPEGKKAHIEFDYTIQPNGTVTGQFRIRTNPEETAIEGEVIPLLIKAEPEQPTPLPEQIVAAIFQIVFRTKPPQVPPIPVDDF